MKLVLMGLLIATAISGHAQEMLMKPDIRKYRDWIKVESNLSNAVSIIPLNSISSITLDRNIITVSKKSGDWDDLKYASEAEAAFAFYGLLDSDNASAEK